MKVNAVHLHVHIMRFVFVSRLHTDVDTASGFFSGKQQTSIHSESFVNEVGQKLRPTSYIHAYIKYVYFSEKRDQNKLSIWSYYG